MAGDGLTAYRIEASLDEEAGSWDCRMEVRWTNNTNEPVEVVPFLFDASPQDSLVRSVTVKGIPADWTYTDGGFRVGIPALDPGKTVAIDLDFRTRDEEYFRGEILLCEPVFPVIPYSGEDGFRTEWHTPANYEVTVTIPQGYDIASTGTIDRVSDRDGRRTIETSARNVPWYDLVVLTDQILLWEDTDGDVPIRLFYFPQDSLWAPKLAGYARDIIEYYTSELGFYPQPVLSIIPGWDRPYGGWPVGPNMVGIHMGLDIAPENHAPWITAHEIGHQYWGFNHTLNPMDYPYWLGIGLGLYTDRMYSLHTGIKTDHDEDFYSDYLKGVRNGINTTVMRPVRELQEEKIDWNNIIVHGKAWAIVRLLELKMGEEAFRQAYDLFLERSAGRTITPEDFRGVCEEVSGMDLSGFFHIWLYTDDNLHYRTDYCVYDEDKKECRIGLERLGKATVDSIEIGYRPRTDKFETVVESYAMDDGDYLKIEQPLPFFPAAIDIDPLGKLPLVDREEPRPVLSLTPPVVDISHLEVYM